MFHRPSKHVAAHLRRNWIGLASFFWTISSKEHKKVYEQFRRDFAHQHESNKEIEHRAYYFLLWQQRNKMKWLERLGVLLVIFLCAKTVHCQIDIIQVQQNGVKIGNLVGAPKINFTNCTILKTNSTFAITCPGGGSGNPGGSTTEFQYRASSNTFGAVAGSSVVSAGFGFSITNPNQGNDASDRRMADFTCTTDSTTSNPNFSDENCLQITENASNGQALYGGATHAKKTFIPFSITGNIQGSGQKSLMTETLNCYSMSDCFAQQQNVTYAGGPIAGDEGQAIQPVSYLQQQGHLNLTTISAVQQTACNTTISQSITASRLVQTFNVASTTGCNVNDWVVIAQEVSTGAPAESLIQITGVGSGTLSGVVVGNYSNGNTITPATVITTNGDAYPWGQDRVAVDLTSTPYTTGTVNNISGAAFGGSGTNWSTSMVGGNSTIIGCVALTNDQFSGVPFTGSGEQGILNSWYQITGVSSATNLSILSQSVAGDAAYHGNGFGSGAYTIRPCAKVLHVSSDSRTIILETNSFTWNTNDSLEEAVTPYPDITAYQYDIGEYTPGGTRRAFMNILNTGARKFTYGINLSANMPSGGDSVAWDTGFNVSGTNIGVSTSSVYGIPFLANAFSGTNSLSQTPCYSFEGMNLGGVATPGAYLPIGLCGNGNTGTLFFNYGSSTPGTLNLPAVPAATARTLPATSGGSINKVACWKDTTGPTLGYCSTQPDSTGSCTCN